MLNKPDVWFSALRIVFGSLYNDEITLNPSEIVPILACSTMFQLDSIIDKCREVIVETINPKVRDPSVNAFINTGIGNNPSHKNRIYLICILIVCEFYIIGDAFRKF